MKKTVTGILLSILMVGASVQAWALRLAYVDVQEVFEQYDGTKTAKDQLKAEAEKKKKELEPEQESLRQAIDDLQQKKNVMNSQKFQAEQEKLQKKAKTLQDKITEVQEDLANQEKKETKAIVEQIRGLIGDVAKDEKYDYILEKSSLLYGGDDVTYKVIKRMNSK